MTDRDEFEQARTAGLRARHETRLARAQACKCTYPDDPACPVHGDEATLSLVAETREARAIRKAVGEEIAQAIERVAAEDHGGDAYINADRAAAIAREIGTKETQP